MRLALGALLLARVTCFSANALAADIKAKDLNPVTFKSAPSHMAVPLVENGQPKAVIWHNKTGDAAELQRTIKEATGVELPIQTGEIKAPAIVIGDCDLAKQNGLDGSKLPPEGFVIKTAPGYVFIVGNGAGTAWAATSSSNGSSACAGISHPWSRKGRTSDATFPK